MENLFINILLGHLIGDYLLQPKKMAIKKSESGYIGLWWSLVHCFIYTLSVSILLGNFSPFVLTIVFISHWPIDRYSLADKYLRLINGRDFKSLIKKYGQNESLNLAATIETSFACLVYLIVDNALHLLLMYYSLKLLF
jgi:hypothetical protein